MGRSVDTNLYCDNEKKQGLLRAKVDRKNKLVLCEYAQILRIKLQCDKRDEKLCQKANDGCLRLKNIMARGLSLNHASLVDKQLNCYYSLEQDQKLK
ncbi:hypothetical protein HBN50_14165 [Halobacteriovorax sp. GB3]|uniref:hypothetical protein n=1 Tax=Halobacteriovorax sp. GB3 TaxID=2719615 RepID=UPI002361D609|nr:hypothetical protein [Halobacteriovorax sp. GB3]MDD0854254.1 hypothetical protein [Halobacteriovorax sp. GB3]